MFVSAAAAVLGALPAAAATYGGGNVQSYASDKPLNDGTIVRLAGEDADKVTIATQSQMQDMFGVTINPNQLTVVVSNEARKNETYVAVSGTYNVLVNTQNGAINTGDYVTLSSVDGVAMKAGTAKEQSTVLGRAQGPFNGKGVTLGTTTIKDDKGNKVKTVKLGLIPVTINIQRNPQEKSTEANLPEILQRAGQQIAQKPVDPIRIYLSMAITGVSLIAAIVVLYVGIRNSVISIGRNPMSKKSIFRALIEIILTSLLILIVGLFAVYLLLKL